MNRIFKVIWSKTKHCYIVVSEYAKANTKAVHTGLRTTAAAAAVAAMLLAPVNYNYAWAADTVTVEEADTSTTTQQTQTVYTTDGADKTFATKADAAVQDAGVVKADKKIGENVTALGKGLYDETVARIGADAAQDKVIQKVNENLVQSVNTINKNVADGFTALNTADANEAKARTDADAAEKAAREVGDTTLDTRITKVKEYLENQTSENYVSKTDAAVQDGAIVKADKTIGENVTNLDAALAKETAARIGADKAQDKVIETVNQNMVDGFNTINTNMANGFAALNQADANEAKARADADAAEQAARIGADAKLAEAVNSSISLSADNVLHKNTTNVDANGIVTTGKADVTEVILNKGGDNQITLSDKGVKVGTNSSVMDKDGVYTGGDTYSDAKAALKSNGSIKGADGDFTVDGTTGNVSTKGSLTAASGKIGNVSMSADGTMTGVKDLTASGRISAGSFTDGTATMSNGSLNGINQINATGNIVTTGNMKAHDITAEGTIKGETINAATGTFSGAVSAGSLNVTNKLTAGNIESTGSIEAKGNLKGDSLTVANNASVGGQLSAGTLTAAGNKFTVGASGNVVAAGIDAGAGTIETTGAVETGTLHATGNATVDGNTEIKGTLKAGATTVDSLDAGSGTIETTGAVETGTLKTTGDAEIGGKLMAKGDAEVGGDLTVKGKLNVDEIDLTKNGIVGDNNVTASTRIAAGEITGYQKATNTKDSSEKESSFDYDANGTSTWAKSTAADNSWKKSNLSVEGDGVTSTAIDSDNNKNTATQSAAESSSVLSNKEGLSSTFKQNVSEILNEIHASDTKYAKLDQKADTITSEVKDGENTTSTTQTATDLTNTAKNGTIKNDANKLVNTASDTIANTAANNITNTSTDGNIANMAANGTISNAAKNLTNTAAESITNTATNGNISNFAANGTITNDARTIANKAAEAMTNEAKTITSTASESVTTQIGDGSAVRSVMNDAGIANMATGKVLTNDAATITNTGTASVTNQVGSNKVLVDTTHVQSAFGDNIFTTWSESGITNTATDKTVATNAKDIQNTATGDITNSAANGTITNTAKALVNTATGNMTNTVGGSKTETVKEAVTEKYGSQATIVDGDQSTNIGGNQTTVVAKNQTNTVSGNKTETVKGAVNETYGSQITTVTGKQTNSITGNQVNTIGGNQTTTVTGDSSLSAKNITNTGTESVVNQVGSHKVLVNTEKVESAFGDNIFTTWDESGITNTAKNGTISNTAKDILNDASGDIINMAAGEIGNTATKITNITGDTTVTSDTNGTIFENKSHNKPIDAGTITKTTISGNTLETGKATMDYAEVMKDLGVRGNAVIDQTLTVKGDSDLQGNATIGKNLTVGGASTFNDTVTVAKGGLTVTGGTQTDTLHVTGASNFDGVATFENIVTMKKGLSVGGNATVTGDVTARSYKVGDKTYIDANGINANGQKITNVVAGTEDSDAANYGQLRKVETRVDGVENCVTNVENRVDKMDSRIDKVGANAAAMANLHPLEFDEDSKWNVAAAVGNYKGETATAVGAFYRPNEDVMFNLSTTFGNDENMVGGGLSLRLGKGGNREKDKKLKAAIVENNDLRAKVDDLTARMDALLSVINPNMSKEFPDVPENHWAYEAVTRLAGNDIVQGYEDGKFHGERTMTRYEMAELIYNALSRGAKAEKKLVEEFKPELQAMAAQKQAK